MIAPDESARALARHVWRHRLASELEAAQRFRALVPALRGLGISETIVGLANEAAADELEHAKLCRQLVQYFGGTLRSEPQTALRRLAPPGIEGRDRVLYEIVAMSCVTETLSTALLGQLVARARDSVCKRAMHTILKDEVNHSRLGWAFLATTGPRGEPDCVGPYLPDMLEATLGDDFFDAAPGPDPRLAELAGLGSLERPERQQVIRETLLHVVFPGLERFGIEVTLGKRWLSAH